MQEDRVGVVKAYDRRSGRMRIRIEHGSVHRGDFIHLRDPSYDALQKVEAIEVDHRGRSEAHEGQEMEVPTEFAVPKHAQVFLVRNEFPGEEY